MSQIKWQFAASSENEGFNASQIAIFTGDSVESITRETIQNSLDARVSKDEPVFVKFELLSVTQDQSPEAFGISEWVSRAAQSQNEVANNKEATNFYTNAQQVLSKSKLTFLAVHDSNTKGLGGPLKKTRGESDGGWISLVQSSGETNQASENSLGSFGIGGKAPYALSELRTLFYLTKTQYNDVEQIRFQGKSILQSMWLGDAGDERTGKTGFFGIYSGDEPVKPLLDAEVPSWAMKSRNVFAEGSGTSLFVLEPHGADKKEEFWQSMRVAVLANFYFAIHSGNLSVELGEGEVISQDTLRQTFKQVVLDSKLDTDSYSDAVIEALESSKTIYSDSENPDVDHRLQSKPFGEFYWYLRMDETVQRSAVGVARQNGMLITRDAENLKSFRGYIPFDIFICVTGAEGSKILRRFENPEHNKFEMKRVQDPSEAKLLNKAYKAFVAEVKALISEKAEARIKEEIRSSDLNHIFGGDGSGLAGGVVDESSLETDFQPAKPRPAVMGEKTRVPGDDTGGAGTTGGTGTVTNPGGATPDPGGTGTIVQDAFVGVQVRNLRFGAVDAAGFVKVHFTPANSGSESRIRFFKSGATEKIVIAFKLPNTDEWLTESPVKDFANSSRKHLKLHFRKEDLNYPIEAVIAE
jgi:hypothetical protein